MVRSRSRTERLILPIEEATAIAQEGIAFRDSVGEAGARALPAPGLSQASAREQGVVQEPVRRNGAAAIDP